MSMIQCNSCYKMVDTDFFEVLSVLDKYHYCEKCMDKDEIFEVIDELQSKVDELERTNKVLVRKAAEAQCELIAVKDAAAQGLERLGVK